MKLFNQNTFRSPFILQITAKTAKQPYILNALKVKWFLPGFNILRSACVKYTVYNGNTGFRNKLPVYSRNKLPWFMSYVVMVIFGST